MGTEYSHRLAFFKNFFSRGGQICFANFYCHANFSIAFGANFRRGQKSLRGENCLRGASPCPLPHIEESQQILKI